MLFKLFLVLFMSLDLYLHILQLNAKISPLLFLPFFHAASNSGSYTCVWKMVLPLSHKGFLITFIKCTLRCFTHIFTFLIYYLSIYNILLVLHRLLVLSRFPFTATYYYNYNYYYYY